MELKPGKLALGAQVGGRLAFFKRPDKSPGKSLPTSERLCSAGHAMGRDWTECPYCKATANAGRQTRVSDAVDITETRVTADALVQVHSIRETRVSSDPLPDDRGVAGGNGRVTRIDPLVMPRAPDANTYSAAQPATGISADPRSAGTRVVMRDEPISATSPQRAVGSSTRKITGILHTFTWNAAGTLFTLRDGRNYGGSGKIALEGNRDADIQIVEDGGISSAHFLILCQSGHYRISDCNSTNGTFVDDRLVDAMGIELVDGARIQAGATTFIFQKVKPYAAEKKDS